MDQMPQEKLFVVSLKGLASRIARVSYEKDNYDLKLYFTLKNGRIAKENLVIEPIVSSRTPIVGNAEQEHKLSQKIASSWHCFAEENLCVAFLSQKDIKDSHATEKLLPRAMNRALESAPRAASLLVVFQSAGGKTKQLLYGSREKKFFLGSPS